jgi:hypothetical protein
LLLKIKLAPYKAERKFMSGRLHPIACRPRTLLPRIILLSLIALSLNVSIALDQGLDLDAPYDLREGEIVRRDIQPGRGHLYKAALTQGQYMNVVIDNHNAYLKITVSDPSHQKLLERRTRLYRPASLSLVAEL